MDLDLKGKRAIVCGSTQGIGLASAMELASLGADITLVARNRSKLEAVVASLPNSEQKHEWISADFGSSQDLKNAMSSYLEKETRADILVNNTGGPKGGRAIDAPEMEFESAFANHLICNQILAQLVVPLMKKNGFGRIINIISTSVKMPIAGLGVSNTIRGAVANWAKTLSVELAPFGITVNNVLPGAAMTGRLKSILEDRAQKLNKTYEQVEQEMINEIPSGRISEPEEVAAAVAFLVTPAAGYINGINRPGDGGRTGCL